MYLSVHSSFKMGEYQPDLSLQQNLEDRRMADQMDSVPSNHTPKGRQFAAVPEL